MPVHVDYPSLSTIPASAPPPNTDIIIAFPTDILLEIFLHCLPERPSRPSKTVAPLQLTGVCREWRTLASQMTRLWTSLEVFHNAGYDLDPLNSIVSHWMERAKHRLLSMSYNFPSEETLSKNPRIMDTILLPFICRIQHLEISMQPTLYQPLLGIKPGQLSHVESISFTNHNTHDNGWNHRARPGTMIDLSGCNRLREVTLNSYSMFGFVKHMVKNIPWPQITILNIVEHRLHPTRARDLLRQCVSLVECNISINHYAGLELDPPDIEPVVVLPDLISLSVRFSGPFDTGRIAPLLQPFSLPRLETLTLAAAIQSSADPDIAAALISLQRRSHPFPLRQLTLTRMSARREQLLAFLHATPNLQSLDLEAAPGRYHGYPSLLVDIASKSGNKALPNLSSVSIVDSVPDAVNEFRPNNMYFRALRFSRHEDVILSALEDWMLNPTGFPGERLKKVSLTCVNAPEQWCGEQGSAEVRNQEFGERVEKLRERGLDLRMPIYPCSMNSAFGYPW